MYRPAPRIVYGTHSIPAERFVQGMRYGAIDTATGYGNALDIAKSLRDYQNQTGTRPYLITKFNSGDFAKGIFAAIQKHREELVYEPDEVLLHSTLGSNFQNVAAIQILREQYPHSRIGASNMTLAQLEAIYKLDSKLDTFQTEYHVNFRTKRIEQFCREKRITLYGYRPFHGINHPIVQDLAKKKGMSADYLVLNWISGKGIIPITSSKTPANIERVAAWSYIPLAPEDITTLDAIDANLDDTSGSTCMKKWTGKGWEGQEFIV